MADILISKFTTQIPRVGATPATPGFAESEGQDPVAPSGTPIQYGIGAGLSLDPLNQIQLGKVGPFFQLVDLKEFESGGVSRFGFGYDDAIFFEDFIYADKTNDDLQKSLTLTSITNYKVNEAYYSNTFNSEYILNVTNGSSLRSYTFRLFTQGISSIASFTDNINEKGLEYTADYESNFTARSLVTKQYVDGAISGAGHNPVTIGSPANGLSIDASQVLTIGLASTSATGALSSTDWNTFNNKLNLTSPITGYTVGANTALDDTDTILQAFGKVQGQINARISGTIASGQVAFGTGVNTVGGTSNFIWDNVNGRSTIVFGSIAPYTSSSFSVVSNIGNTVNEDNGKAILSILNTTNFLDSTATLRLGYRDGSLGAARGTELRSRAVLASVTNGRSRDLEFWTDNSGTLTQIGVWKFNGSFGILTTSPTNTLDVNGTARIRTISNLGTAATSVLVPSATGVLSLRTLAELASDMGVVTLSTADARYLRKDQNDTSLFAVGAQRFWGNASGLTGNAFNIFKSVNSGSPNSIFYGSANEIFVRLDSIVCVGNRIHVGFTSSAGTLAYNYMRPIGGIQPTFRVEDSSGNIIATFEQDRTIAQGVRSTGSDRLTRRDELYLNYSETIATAGTINDLAINASTKLLILTGATDLTGVVPVDNTRLLRIEARSASRIIRHESASSTAANRFSIGADLTINAGEVYQFIYTDSRWRFINDTRDQFAVKTTASADQTLPSGVLTILDYDSTLLNNSTNTYTVATDGRITINRTGIYTITAGVVIEADAVTALESAFLGIFRNGDLVAISSINTTIAAGAQSGLSTSTILSLTATDIIDCRALVNSVGGVANGLARRLGTLLGANATQVNSLSITKNSM